MLFENVDVFDGVRWLERPHNVSISPDGRIESVEPSGAAGGGALLPGFVDAHVHLALADPAAVARGGVTSVLDLGAPLDYVSCSHPPVRFAFAGPLLTAPGGYPTRSWGAGGYGLEIRGPQEAQEAVEMLHGRGASVIKLAIAPDRGPVLDAATMRAASDAAHAGGHLVAAHALTAQAVEAAVEAGVDILAHTPVEPLPDDLVGECGGRRLWVVSTVRAFGDSPSTRRNLTALADAGCTVVYGTDLGNDGIAPGVDTAELERIGQALGGEEAALAAATSVAAALVGVEASIKAGSLADLVWLPSYEGLRSLAGTKRVWINGKEVR